MINEELIAVENKNIIGKRARFKDKLAGYSYVAWNKAGVIITSDRTPYLYLKFDTPIRQGIGGSMVTNSLVICKNSFILEA